MKEIYLVSCRRVGQSFRHWENQLAFSTKEAADLFVKERSSDTAEWPDTSWNIEPICLLEDYKEIGK